MKARTILLNLLESGWGIETVAPAGSKAADILASDPENHECESRDTVDADRD